MYHRNSLPLCITIFLLLFCQNLFAFSTSSFKPLQIVHYVDPSQYAGKWYEIARLPNSFQRGCSLSTAEYTVVDEHTFKVRNECVISAHEKRTIDGVAKIVDKKTNAVLKVTFNNIFSRLASLFMRQGNYWIIDLDEAAYSYAMVGTPDRKFLWILSREPQMHINLYEELVQKAKDQGFRVENIESYTTIVD